MAVYSAGIPNIFQRVSSILNVSHQLKVASYGIPPAFETYATSGFHMWSIKKEETLKIQGDHVWFKFRDMKSVNIWKAASLRYFILQLFIRS